MTVINLSLSSSSTNELYYDTDTGFLGMGSSSPQFNLDIVENEYSAKAILTNISATSTSYANWGAYNGSGYAVFGVAGLNFTLFPNMAGKAYMLADPGVKGSIIVNLSSYPISFQIAGQIVGEWRAGGGLSVFSTGTATHQNGEIWSDGTHLYTMVGGATHTLA